MLGARTWLELDTWPPPDATPATLSIPPTAFGHHPDELPPSLGGRALRYREHHRRAGVGPV